MNVTTLPPGTEVGKYKVVGMVGQGGCARVYRVEHARLGTTCALKVLTQVSPGMRQRLLLEGTVQAKLVHPNIVRVLDVLEIGDAPALLMEFVDGPSLADVLEKRQVSVEAVDQLARYVLQAIQFAHGHDLVHRDLKPENILLARAGNHIVPKVGDFGLVKVLGGQMNHTRTGTTMGTPPYMSPEQVRSAKHVDHRTDLYALGTIFYTCLAGKNPVAGGDDLFEIFRRIVQADYPDLRTVRPGLPERMYRTIEVAMAVDPDERFADAAAMAACWEGVEGQTASWDSDLIEVADGMARGRELEEDGDVATIYSLMDGTAPRPPERSHSEAGPAVTLDTTETVLPEPEAAPRSGRPVALGLTGLALLLAAGGGLLWVGTTSPDLATPPLEHRSPAEPAVQPTSEVAVPSASPPVPAPAEAAPGQEANAAAPASDPRSVPTRAPAAGAHSPAPVPVPPRPAPSVAPAPDPPVPEPSSTAPEPVPTAPAPAPITPEPASPAPEPASVVPAPEPAAPTSKAAFVNRTPAIRVLLRNDTGTYRPGEVPPGTYGMVAFFDDAGTDAGTVTIDAGQTLTVRCQAAFRLCTPETR